jgi:hypothetical protein
VDNAELENNCLWQSNASRQLESDCWMKAGNPLASNRMMLVRQKCEVMSSFLSHNVALLRDFHKYFKLPPIPSERELPAVIPIMGS